MEIRNYRVSHDRPLFLSSNPDEFDGVKVVSTGAGVLAIMPDYVASLAEALRLGILDDEFYSRLDNCAAFFEEEPAAKSLWWSYLKKEARAPTWIGRPSLWATVEERLSPRKLEQQAKPARVSISQAPPENEPVKINPPQRETPKANKATLSQIARAFGEWREAQIPEDVFLNLRALAPTAVARAMDLLGQAERSTEEESARILYRRAGETLADLAGVQGPAL